MTQICRLRSNDYRTIEWLCEEANELNEMVVVIPLGLSALCAYTDMRNNLILNKITIPMSLLGLIYSALAGKMIESLIGLAIGFGILLVGVLRGGAGGGDAKLAGALGAWLGLGILQAISIACVIGLGWGIIRLHRNGLLKTRIKLFFRGIYYWLVYGMQGVLPVSKLPDDEKVKADKWYCDNWTLGLDIKIIAMTIGALVSRRGAN